MEPSRAAPAASSGVSEVEMDATRGGRHQQEERQQYISKVPSSSFLRMLPERVDKLSAADALVAVPVPEQQRLVERFIEYAEQVRGPQLHLLREHDGSDLAKAFLQQVKELQEPFVAADTEADLPANAAGSDSSSASGAVLSNAKEAHLGSSSTVLFRLVEGAISLSPSAVHAPLSGRGFRGLCAAADSDQHGSSTMSTNGEGEDDEVVFAGQLESFLQLAENEIATKELTGWGMEAEGSAAAVKLRSRRVLLAGALVPMALDDTLVLEHKVTLRRGAYQRASSTKKLDACETGGLEATMAASTDAAADVERLRDVLHMHAYEGRLRVILPDDLKPAFTPLRAPRDTCDWAAQLDGSAVVQSDAKLQEFVPQLRQRFQTLGEVLSSLKEQMGGLEAFASGHKVFGFQRIKSGGLCGWEYREWLPNAKAVYLFGDFNGWKRTSHPLNRERRAVAPHFFEASFGALKGAKDAQPQSETSDELSSVWSIFLPDNPDGTPALFHRCRMRVLVVPYEGEPIDRVPAWAPVVWRSEDSGLFNAVLWNPPEDERHVFRHSRPSFAPGVSPSVYEAHIGSSSGEEGRIGSFVEFTTSVLPRIKSLGYNTLLLLDIVEHADFASFGIYVTNHFAVSSRLGTVEEFKALVDRAHALGLRVLISLCHAYSSKNVMDGLGCMDGGDNNYFISGPSGVVENARVFDFSKTEVTRFLLSNISYWLTEFLLDGFRMEGVTWMLYEQRSALRQPDPYDYSTYFTKDLCAAGVLYLSLANSLLSALLPPERRLSIAQECTGYPTLCRPLSQGGLGFDFRLDSSWSQSIRRLIRQSGHRQGRWMTAPFVWAIASKPNTEKLLVSVDDADTTRVCRRRLRIALFAWESLHTHAVGGVAPHVTELAAALSRQGHDVHVFVRATELCGGCSVHYGVAYHECTFDLNRDFVIEIQNMCESFIACMQSVEESMGAEFQICHAHDWLAGKALVKAKQMGRTSILTMHSTEFGRCGNNNYGGVSKRIRDIEAEACHMADRVICVSGVLAEEVRAQYGVHPAKMTVVYNGINCNKFDGEVDSGAVKHMYGVGVLDPMFLFVGRMVVQKGPDLLLEAVPFIHKFRGDAKFVFVGDGHMLDSLKGRAAQLGVTHAVRFVGKMGGGALHALFKSCDAVVVPSRNEPFGIVVLEAWSAAKPVVATNSGGPRDFVNPNITGILVDPTPGSIAWGCCEILKNFEHARWMGSRGRVTAAFSFSWDSIAHQTREIYYEQRNRHDAPPNWTYSSEGDETLAFAIIGPAMFKHMSVEDSEPRVASGLALWRLYLLLGSGLADGCMTFMANEFAHPDCLDLPRPANHFSMAKAFRRWNLAESATLKFTQCELFDCCLNHWESVFSWQSASHLYVVKCDEEAQVVVLERGPCLFAFNFHPHASYEGFQVGCMYSEPMRLFLDSDEARFGGFGRLTPRTQHPATEARDSRPHSVKIYLPSSTCAVYVRESIYEEKRGIIMATPILSLNMEAYVEYRKEGGWRH
ncbi:uncharacterized protein LOC34619934 [Cyclospora cayetanensis]|uniref:Uncharacterized protein LOC34619934 n=1 Tax=Cyclospora cayetanensis TaxID=88456 RepID=A0A6P6RR59_9EIME|nr:uncharacterized protein LOC34619934 [Cyclospora cayetanensis]